MFNTDVKFSCKTSDLLSGLQLVSRAISKQQTLPILGNVLITIEGKRCTLSGTNLEISIVTGFEAQIENEGGVTVPIKAIMNFVQYNQDDEVLLETKEGAQLQLRSKHAKATIAGEPVNDYPSITPITKETSFTLKVKPLLAALNTVTFACAKTTSRPVLAGVFMRIEKDMLILVATDSYRLSEYKLPVSVSSEISCIIPAKVLEELRAVLSGSGDDEEKGSKKEKDTEKKEDELTVNLSAQQIEIRYGSTQILSRLIDGKFPNYEQILPKEKKTTFTISTKDFLTNIKRMHYFAKEMNNNITFEITKDAVKLSTQETQLGKDESEITIEQTGEENKIALSSNYIIDFLTHVHSDTLEVELSDAVHPAVFRVPGGDEFLHLIMPLRMSS